MYFIKRFRRLAKRTSEKFLLASHTVQFIWLSVPDQTCTGIRKAMNFLFLSLRNIRSFLLQVDWNFNLNRKFVLLEDAIVLSGRRMDKIQIVLAPILVSSFDSCCFYPSNEYGFYSAPLKNFRAPG